MTKTATDGVVLALDVGSVRIGVARCRLDVALPQPLKTIGYDAATVVADIKMLIAQENAVMLVIGWPRGMQGQSTQQTAFVEELAGALRPTLPVPLYMQDEALTSQRAEQELASRGKPYEKGAVDALAATYILDDFVRSSVFDDALHQLSSAVAPRQGAGRV